MSFGDRAMSTVVTNVTLVAVMVATMLAANYPYLVQ